MLGSFERLRVGNAVTLTEETLRSGHRLKLRYVLGTFCERFSKKCGHTLSAIFKAHSNPPAISASKDGKLRQSTPGELMIEETS